MRPQIRARGESRAPARPFHPGNSLPPEALVRSPNNNRYFLAGVLLLAIFLVQLLAPWRWPWLTTLQANDAYKQLSGFLLLAFVAYQWRFSVRRATGQTANLPALIKRHKSLGALAPLFFYVHSQGVGYSYTVALSTVFFAVFLTGLANREITRIASPWFQPLWITLHVGLSSALLCLMGYHLYISYAFE